MNEWRPRFEDHADGSSSYRGEPCESCGTDVQVWDVDMPDGSTWRQWMEAVPVGHEGDSLTYMAHSPERCRSLRVLRRDVIE